MQAVFSGELCGPPINRMPGFSLTSVKDGGLAFEGAPGLEAINLMRGVHGGLYGAILDSWMAHAVMTGAPRGSVGTTLEFKVNITRTIPVGTVVRGHRDRAAFGTLLRRCNGRHSRDRGRPPLCHRLDHLHDHDGPLEAPGRGYRTVPGLAVNAFVVE